MAPLQKFHIVQFLQIPRMRAMLQQSCELVN